MLDNEGAKIYINGEILHIAGADDLELGNQNIIKMVKNIPEDEASIFLIHNPANFKQFANFNPNLVLSGHTYMADSSLKG